MAQERVFSSNRIGWHEALSLFLRPLDTLERFATRNVDLVTVKRPFRDLHVVCEASLARGILVDLSDCFEKGPGLRDTRFLLGDGLLTGDGAKAHQQRRAVRPCFTREAMTEYESIFAEETASLLEQWRGVQEIELIEQLREFTVRVAARCFIGKPMTAQALDLWTSSTSGADRVASARMRFPHHLPSWLPTRTTLRAMLASRDAHSALRTVMSTRGDEDEGDWSQIAVLLFAGSETTSSLVTEAFVRLGSEPRLQHEIREALSDRSSVVSAGPEKRGVLSQFLSELLRLTPPVWAIPRRAQSDYRSNGIKFKAGDDVLIAVHAIHRRADRWPDPNLFDLTRFHPSRTDVNEPFLAFGAGPRACPGGNFAMQEARHLVTATVRKFYLEVDEAGLQRHAGLTAAYRAPVRCLLQPIDKSR